MRSSLSNLRTHYRHHCLHHNNKPLQRPPQAAVQATAWRTPASISITTVPTCHSLHAHPPPAPYPELGMATLQLVSPTPHKTNAYPHPTTASLYEASTICIIRAALIRCPASNKECNTPRKPGQPQLAIICPCPHPTRRVNMAHRGRVGIWVCLAPWQGPCQPTPKIMEERQQQRIWGMRRLKTLRRVRRCP